MKIAMISDIHANLPALKAVLKDIEQHQPDTIYCLGDLVNFAGWDNEVIDLIRKKNIPCLQGNHDEGIGNSKDFFSYSFSNQAQQEFGIQSIQLVNRQITHTNRTYLQNLPFLFKIELKGLYNNIRLAMVHGSTTSNLEYVQESTNDAYLLEMMDSIDADILCMGHTHKPWHRAIFCESENKKIYRHAINVGSVGKPKQGNNKACYTLIHIQHESVLTEPTAIQVQFEFVDYPVKNVIKKIAANGLSDAYNNFLLNG
ncbi:metallophosphoesterase family protein [Hydrotalea sp.]|uniref:metallophosphoesterase family protein n=1 Tax=Hydrotalea sp. TaxID=2881279 RepID=UPI0026296338|nr:metallophosphoesterase family protein [Hydrotalea sp.]